MMIVLLVIEKEIVKFVDLEIFHKEKNVLENVKLDGGKIEKNALDVKEIVPNVETVEIAKNVQEEESYIKEIVFLHAQDIGPTEEGFVKEMDGVVHG